MRRGKPVKGHYFMRPTTGSCTQQTFQAHGPGVQSMGVLGVPLYGPQIPAPEIPPLESFLCLMLPKFLPKMECDVCNHLS